MWTDAQLENWRLRQRVELSTGFEFSRWRENPAWSHHQEASAPVRPVADTHRTLTSSSPYERVETAGGIVRLRRKPAEAGPDPLPADTVDDLRRDQTDAPLKDDAT